MTGLAYVPAKYDNSADDMRGENLPQQDPELSKDISNVEDVDQPLVTTAVKMEVLFQARYPSVSYITTIEEGQHVLPWQRCC